MKENSAIRMILTLVVIAVCVAGIMSAVNSVTAPVIAENAVKELNAALAEVIDADSFERVAESEKGELYSAKKGGEEVGACVVWFTPGYGGDIKVLTGVSNSLEVTGVRILEHSETPGLGANADNASFKEQFGGKKKGIGVKKNSPGENDIQAISGATITSRAVTEAVNMSLDEVEKYIKYKDYPLISAFREGEPNE